VAHALTWSRRGPTLAERSETIPFAQAAWVWAGDRAGRSGSAALLRDLSAKEATMIRTSHTKSLAIAALGAVALGVTSAALAAGGVAGKYTTTIKSPSELKGKWALTLAKGGTYTVALNGEALARGKYTATAKTITFSRENSPCVGAGTYAWKKSGKTLRLVRKREAPACQVRAAVLTRTFRQVG
jgi:hypothetical protein